MEQFRTVALAAETQQDGLSAEFPILYCGNFKHSGKDWPVTEADLDQAVANFDAQVAAGTEPPVDYEHGQAEGGVAAGWFKSLRREGSRLLARVKWTEKAAAQIAAGERKYASPEFTPRAQDEAGQPLGFKLLAGGLVVRPHLKGLGPVALSEDVKREIADDARADLAAVGESPQTYTFSMPAVSNPNAGAWNPAIVTLTSTGTITAAGAERPRVTEPTTDTVQLSAEDHAALIESADKVAALTEQVSSLTEKLGKTDKALFAERVDRKLEQARREGRIDASDETTAEFHELAEKLDLDGLDKLIAKIPAETIPVTLKGSSTDKATDAEFGEAPEGTDPDSYKAAKLAEKYEADGMNADEAASKAFQEVYA